MISKKLWVLVISSLVTSFSMHGAELSDDAAKEARIQAYMLQFWDSYKRTGTMLRVEAVPQTVTVPKISDSSVTLPQVQRDESRVLIAKRDFDAKKREEITRRQRARALAAVGSCISMGITPSALGDTRHEPKRLEHEIGSQRHAPTMRSAMAQSAESIMRESRTLKYVPRAEREKWAGDTPERISDAPVPITGKMDATLTKSIMLNCPAHIKVIIDMWQQYLTGKMSSIAFSVTPKQLLLTGVPGTGKTSMGKAIAAECGIPYFMYDGASIASSYKDSGPRNLAKIFLHAARNKPCVVIVDEIETLFQKYQNKHDTEGRMLTKLWGLLDEYESEPILFVATANELEDVPGAFESRFCDSRVDFSPPDQDEREKIITHYMNYLSEGNSKVFDGIKVVDLAKKTKHFCHRHLKKLMGNALNIYLQRRSSASMEDYDHIINRIKSYDSSLNYSKYVPRVAQAAKEWGVPGHVIQLGMHAHNAYNQGQQVKLQTQHHGASLAAQDQHHRESLAAQIDSSAIHQQEYAEAHSYRYGLDGSVRKEDVKENFAKTTKQRIDAIAADLAPRKS